MSFHFKAFFLLIGSPLSYARRIILWASRSAFGRNVGKTVAFSDKKLSEKISYVKFGDHATNLPASIRFGIDDEFKDTLQYKYDGMGNIVAILENGGRVICRYEYDALGRLTREDNTVFGKTTTWAYDNNGNILVKKEYDVTAKPTQELRLLSPTACKRYTYRNNSDQLVSYDGDSFDYDDIGNPDIYRNKEIVWNKGRQMIDYDDGNVEFSYDARGRRTKKNDITFTYDSDGNLIRQSDGVETLVFLYDHTGVFAVKYDNTTYYYRKDAQGNVIALLDNTGTVVVKYAYDAWGNCKALNANGVEITDTAHIGYLNPFRYRGYYYDTETGFYFLKTRYYDPEIGRFISIDDISYLDPDSINGLNLYAYCGNNPVMGYDPDGTWDWGKFWKTVWGVAVGVGLATLAVAGVVLSGGALLVPVLVGAGIGFGASVIGQGLGNIATGKGFFDNFNLGSAIIGALAGAAFATGLGGAFGATVIGALANSAVASFENKSWLQIGLNAVVGGLSAGFGYSFGRYVGIKVFALDDFTFTDFIQIAQLDASFFSAAALALRASWKSFLPLISTGMVRATSKAIGNTGIKFL